MQGANQILTPNPFPGLRPFGIHENHLFFGREGQSETILNYLSKYKFAAITGASGSGKSSLIYCGVIPLLYGGFMPDAGSNWRVLATRPGTTPIWNLAKSIYDADASTQITNDSQQFNTNYFYALLRRHSLGLTEAIGQILTEPDENLLLVIDQFEELFRYRESAKLNRVHREEPASFINLLVQAASQPESRIYVVLTMRSDFIGECSDYQEFTSLINKCNYLVPKMTRTDYEHVIKGPLGVARAEIEPRLLQTLLNSLEQDHDQLPVLQHTLMRAWEFWQRHNTPDSPLSMRDYMSAGKLENALSIHANEAYNELDDNGRQLCKIIFKAITEKGKEGKGIRRPATVREISELAMVQPAEIIKVVEVFRKPGRSFLTPTLGNELHAESVIDISHESLMRVWDKLKAWVDEEAASAQMYLRLIELSGLYQMGRTGLMRPPDLHLATSWKKNQNPNRAWAKRYHPAFEKAIVYLNASDKKFQLEEETKIRIQRRELYRTRRIATLMGVFAMAFLGLMFYTFNLSQQALKQKELVEQYAKILEMQKDTAVLASQMKEYERLLALRSRDSIERASIMQLIQKDVLTQEAYQILEQTTKRTEELEKTTGQIQQEKLAAEQKAQLAQKGITDIEVERMTEKKKRLIILSQTLALKASQVSDDQLSGLLSYHAFLLNRENSGQINHPEIYRGLYHAMSELRGQKFNTIRGQKGIVNSIVFDPSRNILYSSDMSGGIEKWGFRRENPSPANILKNEVANTCLDITVDGRWLACGTENKIFQLINTLQPTQQPRVFTAHDGSVNDIAFIPGRNALVTLGSDNKVKYWDLLLNENLVIFNESSGINDICVDQAGKTVLCVTSNGRILEWNVNTGKTQTLYSHNTALLAISFDYEGENIAVGDRSGNVMILSSTGKLQKTLSAHSSRIITLAFSPDNRILATSGMDGIVRIWNATNWNDLPVEIKEQESWVKSMTFSPDGKSLLTTSNNDQLIYIWPVRAEDLAANMCRYLTRQMSQQEWNNFVGSDVPYREVCK